MKCVTFYDHFVLSFRWTLLNSYRTLLDSVENFRNIIGMNSHSALTKIRKQINWHNKHIKHCHSQKLRCNTKEKSRMKGANRYTFRRCLVVVFMIFGRQLNLVKVEINWKYSNVGPSLKLCHSAMHSELLHTFHPSNNHAFQWLFYVSRSCRWI